MKRLPKLNASVVEKKKMKHSLSITVSPRKHDPARDFQMFDYFIISRLTIPSSFVDMCEGNKEHPMVSM